MTLVAVSGNDHDILVRWSDMVHQLGHDSVILPPASLLGRPQLGSNICLYDLGRRRGANPQILIDAIEACRDTLFVAMTPHPDPHEGLQLLRAGARGYCNRLVSARVLSVLISTVTSGEVWAGKQVTDYLLNAALARSPATHPVDEDLFGRLTDREAGIAQQVAAGHSNKVIAAESGISERTVKVHLNNIFRKTGIRNRVQLALAVSQANQGPRRLSNA